VVLPSPLVGRLQADSLPGSLSLNIRVALACLDFGGFGLDRRSDGFGFDARTDGFGLDTRSGKSG
jgi:hypothetical protein